MTKKIKQNIKEGKGALIGNSGEYFVVAELLKRGVIAALAPRNAPAFDILATYENKTIKIRVKTKSEQYTDWQWTIKKDKTIFKYLSKVDDFTILVNLAENIKNQDCYIIPTATLNKWLNDDFKEWVSTPGKIKKQRNPENPKRHLRYTKFKEDLEKYKNKWEILWS